MIRLSNVCYSYDDAPALSDISLHIPKGTSVVLIGPNGSGKSTLMKVINGLLAPQTGTLFYDDQELTKEKRRDQLWMKRLHQRVGFLFQNSDSQLFCPVVEEEIAFGPLQMGLADQEIVQRVTDCLELLGISHLRLRAPHHLSEGEKKKVALASVLAMNPDALVLDEPMNGLDPRTKRFLREFLLSWHQAGKTLVGSTHDFAYVEGVFQTAIVISADHRLIRTGPYSEIITDEAFLQEHNIL